MHALVLILAGTALVLGGGVETEAAENEVTPFIYELLPGGTHLAEGDMGKGMAFLTSEVSLFTAGLVLNSRVETELNIPLILASQLYTVDKCDYSRRRLSEFFQERVHIQGDIRCDTAPLTELMTAPFRSDVMLSPFVLGCAALGILDGIVAYPGHSASWNNITHARFFGNNLTRRDGTFWYETSAAALSLGAAVSEEMFFRGLLLPILDYRFGKHTGLAASSLIFGFMHVFNPDIDKPVYFIGQAVAAGFLLGYQVQHDRYRLHKAIAAHFWYDIISMTTTWLTNPKENPLGIGVRVAF